MKKRILSLLLCLLLAFTLLPVQQADAATVKEVRIKDILLPVHGCAPSYSANVESPDAPYEIAKLPSEASRNGVRWRDVTVPAHYVNMEPTDEFEYGHKYEVCIAVRIKDESKDSFQLAGADNLPTVTAWLNGVQAPSSSYPIEGTDHAKYLCIAWEYECKPQMVDKITVSGVVAPYADKAPDYNSAKTGSSIYVAAIPPLSDRPTLVRWYDGTENRYLEGTERFVLGHSYTASVTVCTAQFGGGYQLNVNAQEQPALTAVLNGAQAQVSRMVGYSARDCVEVTYDFGPCKAGATQIKTIALGGINVPYVGLTPDYTAQTLSEGVALTGSEWHELYHNGISWYDLTLNADTLTDSTAFLEGHRYRVQIELQAKPGYEFDVVNGKAYCTATVNGAQATVHENPQLGDPSQILEIWYEFAPSTPGTVTIQSVDVAAVTEPVAGEYPLCYAASATQGCYVDYDYTVGPSRYYNGVRWSDVTGQYATYFDGPFQAGHKYRVEVMLDAEEFFAFANNAQGLTLTLNGHPAALSEDYGNNNAQTIVVCYTFPALAETGADEIDSVEAAVPTPYVGAHPGYSATLPPDADYHLENYSEGNYHNGVSWFDVSTGNTLPADTVLQENVAYGVRILLNANEGKHFAQSVSAVVNGQSATAELLGDTLVVTWTNAYAFPAAPSESPFTDVEQSDFFYDAVLWAVNHDPQITSGTGGGKFSPGKTCSRAEVVTFLWRASNCPAPKSKENPFTDVPGGQWYTDAVLWAVENEITTGTGDGKFSPNAPCTRAQVVTFLWRAKGKPAPTLTGSSFSDVLAGQYYTDAVLWAVEHDITGGTGGGKFSPEMKCSRGQIVTFLYRADKVK